MNELLHELATVIYSIAVEMAQERNIFQMDQYLNLALPKLANAYQRYGKLEANFVCSRSGTQVFQHPQYFNSDAVFFHFDVEKLKQVIHKDSSIQAKAESPSLFCTKDDSGPRPYIYAPTDSADVILSPLNEPIIVVPFHFIENSQMLVVDGNHRVTKAKAEKWPHILRYIVPYKQCESYLYGKFECVLYAIIEDLFYMQENLINCSAFRCPSPLSSMVI